MICWVAKSLLQLAGHHTDQGGAYWVVWIAGQGGVQHGNWPYRCHSTWQ